MCVCVCVRVCTCVCVRGGGGAAWRRVVHADCCRSWSYAELDDHNKGVLYHLYVEYFYVRQEALWRDRAMQ